MKKELEEIEREMRRHKHNAAANYAEAGFWRDRFDKLSKQSGERSMQHKQELFDEQERYAALAGKYAELLRDLRRWKIVCCVVASAMCFIVWGVA